MKKTLILAMLLLAAVAPAAGACCGCEGAGLEPLPAIATEPVVVTNYTNATYGQTTTEWHSTLEVFDKLDCKVSKGDPGLDGRHWVRFYIFGIDHYWPSLSISPAKQATVNVTDVGTGYPEVLRAGLVNSVVSIPLCETRTYLVSVCPPYYEPECNEFEIVPIEDNYSFFTKIVVGEDETT